MKALAIELILIGSMLPGFGLMAMGLRILGAVLMAGLVLAALAIIGGYIGNPQHRDDDKHPHD